MSEERTSIVSQQRFLTAAQCAELVAFTAEKLPEMAMAEPGILFTGRVLDRPQHPTAVAAARRAATLLSLAFDTRLALETHQLVAWPEGTEQPVHVDRRRVATTHAAIAYLNDDFDGGQTYFPDLPHEAQPVRGLLIGFPGGGLPHGVRRVERGTRYTLALWFVPG